MLQLFALHAFTRRDLCACVIVPVQRMSAGKLAACLNSELLVRAEGMRTGQFGTQAGGVLPGVAGPLAIDCCLCQ
jgi:hypothetical protein